MQIYRNKSRSNAEENQQRSLSSAAPSFALFVCSLSSSLPTPFERTRRNTHLGWITEKKTHSVWKNEKKIQSVSKNEKKPRRHAKQTAESRDQQESTSKESRVLGRNDTYLAASSSLFLDCSLSSSWRRASLSCIFCWVDSFLFSAVMVLMNWISFTWTRGRIMYKLRAVLKSELWDLLPDVTRK
jgi:hypothetical protein